MKDKENLPQSGVLTKLFLLILLTIIALFSVIIYHQKKNLNLLGNKMNNLISEMSSINDKYKDIEEKIEVRLQKNGEEKYEVSLPDEQKLLDKKLLVNCLLDIREAMSLSNKIPENCYIVFYLENRDIREKTDQLDFVTRASKSYKQLEESFIEVSKSIEKDLFRRKLLNCKIPKFFAEYLPNLLTWRKVEVGEVNTETSELSLIKCEKHIKEKNIELVVKELKNFGNLDIVNDWMESAAIYQKNSDLLKEILEKILEEK